MPNEVKLLPCDKCAICGKSKSQHPLNSGYGMCQIYPVFVSEHEMLERLSRPTTVVTDEVVERVARAIHIARYGERKPEPMCDTDWEYCDRLARAAIASMPTVVTGEQQGWLPIESAPKDGQHVDLWLDNPALVVGGQRVTDAFWFEGRWLQWSPVNDLDEARFYAPLVGPCEAVETSICKATHFQPLPEPPAQPGDA